MIRRVNVKMEKAINDGCFHFVSLILKVLGGAEEKQKSHKNHKSAKSHRLSAQTPNSVHKEEKTRAHESKSHEFDETSSFNFSYPHFFLLISIDHSRQLIVPLTNFRSSESANKFICAFHHAAIFNFSSNSLPGFIASVTIGGGGSVEDNYMDHDIIGSKSSAIENTNFIPPFLQKYFWSLNLEKKDGKEKKMIVRQLKVNNRWISFENYKSGTRAYNDKTHKVFGNDCMNGGSVSSDGSCCCLATSYHGSKCHIGCYILIKIAYLKCFRKLTFQFQFF